MEQTETITGFPALQGHQYMQLTTFRKSGKPVQTPVWFTERGGNVYIFTTGQSGKVKRVRANGRAEIAPSDARGNLLGASARGIARVLPPEDTAAVYELFTKKYGIQMHFFSLLGRLRRATATYLELVPAREETA